MSARIIAVGINAQTQTVDSVGEHSGEEVMQMLRAGQIVVPATEQLCRDLWGTHIPKPYALALGMVQEHRSPLWHIASILGLDENTNSHRICKAIAKLQEKQAKPLDVVLHCPACKRQHIDQPDYPNWKNPPHRTHKCAGCGQQWTPADTHTNGVRAVKPGSSATWPAPDLSLFSAAKLPARGKDGTLWHPDIPDIGDDEIITPYLWAIGFDGAFVSMETDASPAVWDAYSDAGEPDCSAWTPSPPKGDGWLLAAIYDTEDGPHAMYVRPFQQLVPMPRPVQGDSTDFHGSGLPL